MAFKGDHIMSDTQTGLVQCQFCDENLQAEEALTQGKYPEAANILVSIVEKDPLNWRAFNNLGILSWSKENWQDAYIMFKKAISIKGDYEDALVNLFDAALKLHRIKEVAALYDKALEINLDLQDARVIRETIVAMKSDIYQSKRALQIGFFSPILDEAKKLLDAGDYYGAMKKFLESIDVDGPNGPAYCGLGIINYYQQRFQDAYSLFIESIRHNPCDTETYLNLLDAAKEINKTQVAKDIYNIYKKEFPELEVIASNFEGL